MFRSICTIFARRRRAKLLTLGYSSKLDGPRLTAALATVNVSNITVMTTVELRTSIVAELDQMTDEMLENVQHYVRRLRRRTRPVKRTVTEENVPDIVLSLLGAGEPVADDDLNAREAYHQYLEEKYQ